MTEINDLRERVEAAEQRFGLMDEQQRHYSQRVIGLIETIEAQLAAARDEIEKQIDDNQRLREELAAARDEIEKRTAENQRLAQENEELRSMLHSMLRAIEEKTFTETLQNLESRVSALVAGATATAAAPAEAPAPAAEMPEDAMGEDDAVPATLDAMVEPETDESPADAAALIVEAEAESETETEAAEVEAEAAADETADEAFDATDDGETPVDEMAVDEMAVDEMAVDALAGDEAAAEGSEDTTAEADGDEPDLAAPDSETAGDEMAGDEMAGDDGSEPEMTEEAMEEPGMEEAVMDEAAAETAAEPSAMNSPEAEMSAETATEAADDGVDGIFAAMAELNAADEAFVETVAEGSETVPEEPAMAAPEAAAEDNAAAEEEAVAEEPVDVAPTVKEIIRRVGDLARELERAEAARRASLDHKDDGGAEPPAEEPPLDHAANG
jgi:hypothetical protein